MTEPVPEALPGQLASFTFETSIAGSYAGKTHLVDALNYRFNFGILTSLISSSLTIPQPNRVFGVIFLGTKFTIQYKTITLFAYFTRKWGKKIFFKLCPKILIFVPNIYHSPFP